MRLPPQYVKPFVNRGRSDGNDTVAICGAVRHGQRADQDRPASG